MDQSEHSLEWRTRRKLRRLVQLGKSEMDKGKFGKWVSGDEIPYDEFLPLSIIYTLFYANLHSADWILNFEYNMPVQFPFVDVQLVIRAMIERTIHQAYILTNPEPLAKLFTLWGTIERYKYQNVADEDAQSDSISTDSISKKEYKDAIKEWEATVQSKQKASKARNWSGLNLFEMTKITDFSNVYRRGYKYSSWYTHGLIHVSDYYLKVDENDLSKSYYASHPTFEEKVNSLLDTTSFLTISFVQTSEYLDWEVEDQLNSIWEEKPSPIKLKYESFREWNFPLWLKELIK